jgi:hypothetical protein
MKAQYSEWHKGWLAVNRHGRLVRDNHRHLKVFTTEAAALKAAGKSTAFWH